MARIRTYDLDYNVTGSDYWIGTDGNNNNNTKNFSPNSVAQYLNENEVIDSSNSLRYRYDTIQGLDGRKEGTLSFQTERGATVPISSLSTFILSKNTQSGKNVSYFLNVLPGKKVLFKKSDDINIFGLFNIVSITVNLLEPNFFNVTLQFLYGNGSIEEDKDYMISLIDISLPESQNLQGVTDLGSTTTNSITAESFIKQDGTGENILLDDGTTIPLTDVGNQDLQSVLENGNTSDIGISLYLETASTGLSSTSLDGIGIFGSSDSGTGVQASSSNLALKVLLNNSTQTGVSIESLTGSTGTPLNVTKNNVTKLSINQDGELTATKLIKNGGTGTNILLDNGNTLAVSTIPTVTPSALTKTNDTNVTLTLGGSPSTALLQGVSLTLGWTGTLADSRIASAATWNAKENVLTFSSPLSRSVNTVSMPAATTSVSGYLTSTNFTTFNNKQNALGFTPYNATNPSGFISLTALSATSPIFYNNTSGVISSQAATTSVNGYLTSTNWNTFNNKENSLGNPAQDGYVLSSTTTGTRSWVAQAAGFEANFLLMGA